MVSPMPIRTPRLFSAKLLSGCSAPSCAVPWGPYWMQDFNPRFNSVRFVPFPPA